LASSIYSKVVLLIVKVIVLY